MSDDMKVQVDITADLSKLESSLNTAYEKTRAAGTKMQGALKLTPGNIGGTGPGAPSVAPAFTSNQVAFGGGLNVQRAANFGYGSPIGPMPQAGYGYPIGPPAPPGGYPSAIGPPLPPGFTPGFGNLPTVPPNVPPASWASSLMNARNAMSAAKVGLASYVLSAGYSAIGGVGGGIRHSWGSSKDPLSRSADMAASEHSFRSIPVIGNITGSLIDAGRSLNLLEDFGTSADTMGKAEVAHRRAFMGFDGGGYYGAARDLTYDRTVNFSREVATMRRNNASKDSIKEFKRQSKRVFDLREQELKFSRTKDLVGLDTAANAESFRMFGSDFAADQLEISNKADMEIKYANLQGDTKRSAKLKRLKEVMLLSSALSNVGTGVEMSAQATALGGVRPGQINLNDPVVLRMLDMVERIADATENSTGGVPVAR